MDIQRPHDDPFGLVGDNWVQESESAYTTAELSADDAGSSAASQARFAMDAASKMVDEKGHTADSVSGEYGSLAGQLLEQSRDFTTIAAWMTDAASEIRGAKKHIASLVVTGTSEIKDTLTAELQGTPITPPSNELTDKYRSDIAAVKTTLDRDLDAIGHSLHGDAGSSTTPSYTSVPTAPSAEHTDPRATVVSYNHGDQPQVTPKALPEMPRATASSTTDSASGASTPATPVAPHPVNPTLANLIGGGQPTGAPSTSFPHTSSQGSPSLSPQAHQAPEHRQEAKPAGAPRIPSLQLPEIPSIPLDTITTAVSSAAAHQLPAQAPTPSAPSVPASTGITPGVAGTPPMAPVTPTPLTPIGGGGGGLATPAAAQPATPAPQATPVAPSPAPQQTASTRSPAADLSWIQRTYGLAPGIEAPKPETALVPALFIADLPEDEAHLHRVLAAIRQEFDGAGWSQPLAVATLRRGFETKLVYVTADAISIRPRGVLLPHGVTPLDDMPYAPTYSDMNGSLMVSEKLTALIPRGWETEGLLSTVPADEQHQTAEQYQELSEAGELLDCKVSRGPGDVEADEAMAVFARAALGSGGCGELDSESARLRGSRWVGMQLVDYLGVMARYHLADAADSMSRGAWGEAVYCSEKYLGLIGLKSQVA